MATRKELIVAVGTRYRAASRQQRTAVLDEFIKTTGYQRKHAIRVLSAVPPSVAWIAAILFFDKNDQNRPSVFQELNIVQ